MVDQREHDPAGGEPGAPDAPGPSSSEVTTELPRAPVSPAAMPGASPFANPPASPWAPPSTVTPPAPAVGPPPLPTGWAPPRPAAPVPAAPAAGPGAAPGYPPGAPPGWTGAAASTRTPDAPVAWWTRDLGAAGPPEYDPSRIGPLGASGGVPLLPSPAASPQPAGGTRRTGVGTALVVGVVSAVIASLITGGLFLTFTDTGDQGQVTSDRGPAPTLVAPLDIYGLLEKAQPSVVSIRTDVSSSSGTTPFGAGSGVIISEDGLVLTNAHVIAGSSSMTVTLYDGHEAAATLVGSFPDDDIALIRLSEPGDVTPAVLGNSADIVVGDPVVAIGNALNLGGPPSVTEGIVSAKDRNIQTSDGTLRNLIQTDAAINPGNSGGPLLNAQGQVVGINTAIIDDAQNIGFAIAIDLLKPLIEDLKEGRGAITPESPFLGVSTQALGDVTDAVLERYGVTADEGAFVSDVVPGSGAAEAGLQPGDVIVAIDGEPVTSSTDVGAIIRNREAGEMITIEIERQGEPQTITATLKSRAETGN
jgi:putative serine protease PepD